jgi:hypothetical protein
MKFKEYFLKLKEQGKIKNEEYDKFIETVPEGEMPDTIFPILENTFLTLDRAAADASVKGRLKSELLDPIDNDLKSIMKNFPADKIIEIEREQSTYKKMQLIKEMLPDVIAKSAKAPNDEEAKKKLEAANHAMHELTEKFTKLNTEREQEKKTLQSDYDNKIKSFQLDTHLQSLVNSYTFADSYKETRNTLTKAMLGEIKQKHKLDLVEKEGELDIRILGEDGTPRFEGNTPVTISSLLDSTFKPFLKVNNAEGEQTKRQETQQYKVQDQNPSIRRGANTSVQL